MREGNYRVKVTILEANDLIPWDLDFIENVIEGKGGSMDPMVMIKIGD